MPDENLLRLVFGTPIRPGGRTLGQILGRKVVKRSLRQVMGVGGDDKRASRKRRKRADVEQPNEVLAKMSLLNLISRATAIEKDAKKKDKKTYPISRFLTSPKASAIEGGVIGALSEGLVETVRLAKGKVPPSAIAISAIPRAIEGGLAGAGVGALATYIQRVIHARARKGRHALKELASYEKGGSMEKEAPFKSQAQRRKFYAMAERGEISKKTVKKWEEHTPSGKLPERVHRKAAELEKEALIGALLKPLAWMGKGMLGFGGRAARAFGTFIGWPGVAAASSMKSHRPMGMQPMQPMMSTAAVADALLQMTKESFEIRDHSPASTDVAEPIVKKNSMSKSSAEGDPSLGGMVPVTPARTSGRSWSTVNPGTAWLRRSTTKPAHHAKLEGPEVRQVGGQASEESVPGPETAGAHITRPRM